MTCQQHLLSAEAQLLMAEERMVVEEPNAQRAQKLQVARKYLEEAILAGEKQAGAIPEPED